ncbi:MAG: shikimate dehydrogenase [Dehalococcoidales bacterium]|nr:shikimate dehydrogenase [Dehalococcoidales bacterium]
MTSVISGKTTVCGIIGDPVEHSMSPVMHNAAFGRLGMDFVYVPFHVKKEALVRAVAGIRGLNIRGVNVTIPHKVAIMGLLDKIDPLAEKIGAVNTVVNDDGVLTGYNTDATGFFGVLLENGITVENKNVVIIGAGGVSRAVAFILGERGAKLTILNRNVERANELGRRISELFGEVKVLELNEGNMAAALEKADILVNATSVGMHPSVSDSPITAKLLRRGLTVCDLVYNPIETKLLKEAKAAGAPTIGGLDMLVWQGALAFEKWTGRKAPIALMKKQALKSLTHED